MPQDPQVGGRGLAVAPRGSPGRPTRAARCALAALAVCAVAMLAAPVARGDGDPGSDVLVYQQLFVASDAGMPVAQQLALGRVLRAAAGAGFPVRVAIIAKRDDLGAITELWRRPRAYARFLGIELSTAYAQRLLVVMPNGFGFNWPRHSTSAAYRQLARIAIGPGGVGLADAAERAVQTLAGAAHVTLHVPAGAPGGTGVPASATGGAVSQPATQPNPGRGTDTLLAIIVAGVAALVALALGLRAGLRRRRRARRHSTDGPSAVGHAPRARLPARTLALVAGAVALFATAIGAAVVVIVTGPSSSQASALARNPYLDPGTALSRPAPEFTLTDQFGRQVSLREFRGKVVILAFNDSECTTICPLTTSAMADARSMLGAAASRVQLLGVDANPKATSVQDVLSYSELHGLQHEWHFVTGSLAHLEQVWKAYGVEAEISRGQIAHTPALFVIDPHGDLRRLYLTQQSYAAVGQLGQLLAQEASALLPSHPRVHSGLSYAPQPAIAPSASAVLPEAGGGTVRLGPGARPRLTLFFDTWDREVTGLGGELDALNGYASSARRAGLPALTAVDEASVEPSSAALPQFLRALPRPLTYPVAVDTSGRVGDGYQVQGEPWFVLTSATGRILWYWQVTTSGWLTRASLAAHVRAALARAPRAPVSITAAGRELAASPPPLAALHGQASRLLGGEPALAARLRALRGYPVVINAWASWCGPCRSEFSLFASASAHFGRRVAFVGVDTSDSPGDARAFLAQHHVSYPSYQSSTTELDSVLPGGVEGLPTTIYISRGGKVLYVHTGQYEAQGSLDADIGTYALDG
jgi:cytochrome oxidase Cu insertion factor (SCO1/SenC/PrrC family)/thiol-disulfide isomerase/thioredoxin